MVAGEEHGRSLGQRVADLAALPHRPNVAPSPMAAPSAKPEEFDVVVVGSGGAALAAAAGALSTGVSVLVCEKGPVHGGTTANSGGVAHIYANRQMKAAGIEDPRDDALAYMARVCYPGAFDPEAPRLGLGSSEFAMLATYYDRGAEVIGIRDVQLDTATRRRLTEQILAEAAAGTIHPVIGQAWPLERAAQAHAAIESRTVFGTTQLLV